MKRLDFSDMRTNIFETLLETLKYESKAEKLEGHNKVKKPWCEFLVENFRTMNNKELYFFKRINISLFSNNKTKTY